MGGYRAKRSANLAVDHMTTMKFMPATLLNVGVGSCPEYSVWVKRLPATVKLFGVDCRARHRWGAEFLQRAVGSVHQGDVYYCSSCRSIKCNLPDHPKSLIGKAETIDWIVQERNLKPPFFLWIDIEGAELDALRGGENTLKQTPLINLEMHEFQGSTTYCKELHEYLVTAGYGLVAAPYDECLEDRLYMRSDWLASDKDAASL